MPKRIYVGNLPVKAEANDLQDFCASHGEVVDVKLKGSNAAITMASGAESAAKALKAKPFGGNTLEVTIHHAEQDFEI